ncbi:hypothetical protein SAMN04490200_4001 [Pseudomonas proteolytica]|nr:hypothetical protein SAMN04490200_4001 [Pseudomonas proteolytica]
MWRAGLPRAGWRSHPNSLTMLRQTHRGGRFWGCCAAQRDKPPRHRGLAAPSSLLCDYWLYVASGLAPRWVAKPPQPPHHAPPDTPRWQVLGLLRSPTGAIRRSGKPPRHRELAAPSSLLCDYWLYVASGLDPGGEATPTASPRSARYTEMAGFGAAAQPSGGDTAFRQAPSPRPCP